VPLYRQEVRVSFAINEPTANTEAAKYLDATVVGTEGSNAFVASSGPFIFVWFGPDSDATDIYHEAYHTTREVLTYAGSTFKDEELEAYLHGFITNKLVTLWKEYYEQ
jgi:hypothetical protein